jgi:aminomethyltransferase
MGRGSSRTRPTDSAAAMARGSSPPRHFQRSAPVRKLVGFELVDRGVARDGYAVLDAAGNAVGKVTSGGPSPSLDNKCIGLAYVPVALSAIGTELGIDVRGRSLKAVVVKPPFVASHVKKS